MEIRDTQPTGNSRRKKTAPIRHTKSFVVQDRIQLGGAAPEHTYPRPGCFRPGLPCSSDDSGDAEWKVSSTANATNIPSMCQADFAPERAPATIAMFEDERLHPCIEKPYPVAVSPTVAKDMAALADIFANSGATVVGVYGGVASGKNTMCHELSGAFKQRTFRYSTFNDASDVLTGHYVAKKTAPGFKFEPARLVEYVKHGGWFMLDGADLLHGDGAKDAARILLPLFDPDPAKRGIYTQNKAGNMTFTPASADFKLVLVGEKRPSWMQQVRDMYQDPVFAEMTVSRSTRRDQEQIIGSRTQVDPTAQVGEDDSYRPHPNSGPDGFFD